MRVRVTDQALAAIVGQIGGVVPEAGGALLGPPGSDLVTGLVLDQEAAVTGVRYRTSGWLIDRMEAIQREGTVRFKGIVHSHPSTLPEPSAQDRHEYARSLGINPHLGRFVAPIVTHELPGTPPPAAHELSVDGVRVSWFCAVAAADRVEVLPMHPIVLPVAASLERAGARDLGEPEVLTVDGVPLLAVRAAFEGLPSVRAVLFGVDFPAVPPVLVSHGSPVALTWDPATPPEDRLARAVATAARAAHRPSSVGARLRAAPGAAVGVLTRRGPTRGVATGLFARSAGLLAPDLADRHVVVAGAGSVGGYVAECLARSGVGGLTLLDPELVAPENLGRSPYTARDVGRPKVTALASRLAAINPEIVVRRARATVHELDPHALAGTLRSADLLVAATDDARAQRRLDHLAYWTGVPALFPGLYRAAAGGEVIMTYPGAACWGCATAGIRGLSTDTALIQPTDYGTGRLVAAPGLIVDIQYVSAAATKIALALLHAARGPDGQPDGPVGPGPEPDAGPAVEARITGFLDGPRERGQTYVAFGTEPGYWLFGHVLRDAPGQHAFQSVWMAVDRQPGCPVCGPDDARTDPLAGPGQVVSSGRLRQLVARGGRT
ncbi:ThiF family adenylyltransferase [Planotetraspora sp. GP83]|uniref:ThiF family adenylyltransferase n=1 Tax=Planotetraspora sp. GP83 TaxID=3156264 RepID=UPI0035175889